MDPTHGEVYFILFYYNIFLNFLKGDAKIGLFSQLTLFMANKKVNLSLADLKFDIGGALPLDLIRAWWESDRREATHLKLLEPHYRQGIVVSTDSAGLSKLSVGKPLLEVMSLISAPKKAVFKHGSKIGGQGLGLWVADNTQMFYDQKITADQVVESMLAVQAEIANHPVKIGMAAHAGRFLELGGGLYGQEAELVEKIAENEVRGGEVVVTDAVRLLLSNHHQNNLEPRKLAELNLPAFSYQNNHSLAAISEQSVDEQIYPIPFAADFYHYIHGDNDLTGFDHPLVKKYLHHKVVILIKLYHPEQEMVLDAFAAWLVADNLIRQVAGGYPVEVVKSNGDLAIVVADSEVAAMEYAEKLYEIFLRNELEFSIGLAKDHLLIFPLENGGKDLAGSPVNLASKIAEDIPEKNTLMIHESVNYHKLQDWQVYENFELERSGVLIKGKRKK